MGEWLRAGDYSPFYLEVRMDWFYLIYIPLFIGMIFGAWRIRWGLDNNSRTPIAVVIFCTCFVLIPSIY